MKECNKLLHAQGKPYPRTCALCGLGHCHNVPVAPERELIALRDEVRSKITQDIAFVSFKFDDLCMLVGILDYAIQNPTKQNIQYAKQRVKRCL